MRFRWKALIAAPLVLAAGIAAGWPVYVRPSSETFTTADAAIVLGTSYPDRILSAVRLEEAGRVPVVAVSLAADAPREPVEGYVCDERILCFTPEPLTTRGEVQAVNALALQYGWRSVVVVTGTAHVSRARFIFDRCSTVPSTVVEFRQRYDVGDWAYEYLYQTAGYIKAALVDCSQ